MSTGREAGRGSEGVDAPSDAAGTVGARLEAPGGTSPSAGDGLVFDDPLDRPSSDDTDRGWGDAPSGTADDDDFTRFLNEKPPHHL